MPPPELSGFRWIPQTEPNLPPLCANTEILWKHTVSLYLLVSVYWRKKDSKTSRKREGESEWEKLKCCYCLLLGVCNRHPWQSERVLRDEKRVEKRTIIEVRGRSKLWSILATEGKAFVFGLALIQKLNQPIYRAGGLEEPWLYWQWNKHTHKTPFFSSPVQPES